MILAEPAYEKRPFAGLDMKDQELADREFEGCTFTRCSFAKAVLKRCRFIDCGFESCDLSLMKVTNCSLRDVSFRESKLVGVNWSPAKSLVSLSFERCLLDYAVFSGLDLRRLRLVDCRVHEADFSEANLSDAVLAQTDFRGARFVNADLTRADLRGAVNYLIDPKSNILKKAKFSLPEAMSLLRGLDIEIE